MRVERAEVVEPSRRRPTSLTGRPSSCAIATATPPFAEPSSFVSATPVTPTVSRKSRACCRPFWPVVASTTSSVSCGAPASSLLDHAAHLRELLHQVRLRVQAAGGVDDRRRRARGRAPPRSRRRRRRPGRRRARSRRSRRRRARAQISSCSSAAARKVSAAASDDAVPVLAEALGELADRRRLAGAVDADDEDDARALLPRRACRARRAALELLRERRSEPSAIGRAPPAAARARPSRARRRRP